MRLKIKKALEALENLPGGNASRDTVMEYQRAIVYPATQSLKEAEKMAFGQEDAQVLINITSAYIEAMEGHLRMVEVLERFFNAKFELTEQEGHEADLEQIKVIKKKLEDLLDAEQVEELLATPSKK